jgi:hypothetical protein
MLPALFVTGGIAGAGFRLPLKWLWRKMKRPGRLRFAG